MIPVQQRGVTFSHESLAHPRECEQQARYRAYLFGAFRVFCQDKPIDKEMRRRSKAGTLLKWFLLHPGKMGSADEFIDLFWPDIPAKVALCNLHVTIHYLRHLLQPELAPRQESHYIRHRHTNFYVFEMDKAWWADALDVPSLFEEARTCEQSGHDRRAAFYYRKVISYCSLGFLPEDAPDPWLEPHIRRYQSIYSQALQRMIQLCMQRDELEDTMEYAYQALTVDPYCESATRALVHIHMQQGNMAAASRALNDFCAFFQQTWGVGPAKDLRLLRDQLREAAHE